MAKLLIVDDDINLLTYLEEELTDAGFEVKTLDNGADAIVIVSEEKFDLVLLDMLMPGLDGIQVVRILKKIIPEVPIIGLTGYIGRGYLSQAANLGVRILTKPIVFSELVGYIQREIESTQSDSTQ